MSRSRVAAGFHLQRIPLLFHHLVHHGCQFSRVGFAIVILGGLLQLLVRIPAKDDIFVVLNTQWLVRWLVGESPFQFVG